jgi:hypothetical protein
MRHTTPFLLVGCGCLFRHLALCATVDVTVTLAGEETRLSALFVFCKAQSTIDTCCKAGPCL